MGLHLSWNDINCSLIEFLFYHLSNIAVISLGRGGGVGGEGSKLAKILSTYLLDDPYQEGYAQMTYIDNFLAILPPLPSPLP